MEDLFSLDAYGYELPQDLIAQYPIEPRDHARLLIVDRKSGGIEEARVYELPQLLQREDALIFNNTRVLHARLYGFLESGKRVETLLIKSIEPMVWHVLAKPARDLSPGTAVQFPEGIRGIVQAIEERGSRIMQFSHEITPELLQSIGTVPLPHISDVNLISISMQSAIKQYTDQSMDLWQHQQQDCILHMTCSVNCTVLALINIWLLYMLVQEPFCQFVQTTFVSIVCTQS